MKYPTKFNCADVAIITKSDLAAAVEFDEEAARRNIRTIRPGMQVFKVSSKTGEGITEFLDFFERLRLHSSALVSN